MVSVLNSGAEGPRFKSQSRHCRVTLLKAVMTVACFAVDSSLSLFSVFLFHVLKAPTMYIGYMTDALIVLLQTACSVCACSTCVCKVWWYFWNKRCKYSSPVLQTGRECMKWSKTSVDYYLKQISTVLAVSPCGFRATIRSNGCKTVGNDARAYLGCKLLR